MTVVLDNLADELTEAEVCAAYPPLAPEDVQAALAYGAELAREEDLLPIRAASTVAATV